VTPARLLSIVVPAYNEAEGIEAACTTLARIGTSTGYACEIIVVDDGSRDATFERASALRGLPATVRVIGLSRNFGKEAALLAGLRRAAGDAVITIDADLQHPPSLIPAMVLAWERGSKVVHGIKRSRGDESFVATWRAALVNRLLTHLGEVHLQRSSDYKLLDRAAVDVVAHQMTERMRLYRGLAEWVGFPQTTLEFDVAPRLHGQSAWSLRSLLGLTLTALVSFSSAPLRLVSLLGLLTFLLGAGIGGEALWSWVHGRSTSGFVTVIMTLLLIGSFIMISLGIIGEYIAKIYEEIKRRPEYIIGRCSDPPEPVAPQSRSTEGTVIS
jgi:glycosyltransferase involved in cell wall biosynthesis